MFREGPMRKFRVCSLFSGIGGIELGLDPARFHPVLLCENDPTATSILKSNFPDVELASDVTSLKQLPSCEVLTAGWPCQDLSQAGSVRGMNGNRSSLVSEVFRLLRAAKMPPQIVVLENVAFALHLHGGDAIGQVTNELSALGYRWAYRILDTQLFGLPQRRRRVFIVAATDIDPAQVLFEPIRHELDAVADPLRVGFYWTEGNRGVGWTPEAVPPLKGGSGLSIPSPPALWDRATQNFFVPGIVDAERLQGFPANWTFLSEDPVVQRARWRLVGNAVSVPVVRWLSDRLAGSLDGEVLEYEVRPTQNSGKQHNAGVGSQHSTFTLRTASEGPTRPTAYRISDFDFLDARPLSYRAASGFLARLLASRLAKEPNFVRDLTRYCATMGPSANRAA
jgi:DNA (cytosine-5)-methyltransferase 1